MYCLNLQMIVQKPKIGSLQNDSKQFIKLNKVINIRSNNSNFVVQNVGAQQQSVVIDPENKQQKIESDKLTKNNNLLNTSSKVENPKTSTEIQFDLYRYFLDTNNQFKFSALQLLTFGALISLPIIYYTLTNFLPEEQSQFLLQSILVTLGACSFGYAPYVSKVQGEHLEYMSSIGAGLLVSMALTMIIPSGTEQYIYNEMAVHQQHMVHMGMGETIMECYHTNIMPMGNAILTGFGSLFLLDVFQQMQSKFGCKNDGDQIQQISMQNGNPQNLQMEQSQCMHTSNGPQQAITGLVIHSMADGLAMGTSALSGNLQLGFMVGLAMILHRGPMAFALAAYLRQVDYPESDGLKGVWAFSLACPLTAIFIYYILGGLMDNTDLMGPRNIALAMLFSGGSFLYAGFVHILPSVMKNVGKIGTTLTFVGGMALPIVMMASMGHHHHH